MYSPSRRARRPIGPLAAWGPPPWRWFHGVVVYALIQVLTFGLYRLVGAARGPRAVVTDAQVREFYEEGYRPVFSPPPWAFGPAWTLNNLCAIWGLLRALNKPSSSGRDAFLALQAASWLDFILFAAACFGLRSPINGLALTALYLVLTIASGLVAIFGLRDSKLALSLATLFIWLVLATSISAFSVLWNDDEFYGVGPFAPPDPRFAVGGKGERVAASN
jgi:translocator protein